jgi:aspartyl-tRNA(Asn)/glutamyl-tRNA(Gln) amidotransferase subunit A
MSHSPFNNLTIKKFHQGLVNKDFKALDIAEAYFKVIEEKDKEIGAYLTPLKDLAYTQAEETDLRIARKEAVGELAGVPLALKDNMLVKGERTTAGSKILNTYRGTYDATVISKLKNEGVVFLGKTNLDEFAMGASTENSGFHPTKNPHDLTRVPGGSSGGSAAAVAGHMALAALGSDTGGSIRQPAAFCGVVGLKPTYGAVSRHGLIAMASSLDQIGPITRTVEDAAIIFKAIAGQDSYDSTSVDVSYGDELTNPDFQKIKSLTVGIPEEYFIDPSASSGQGGIEPEVRAGVESVIAALKSAGIKFKKISLPHTKYALSAYYIIVPAEVSSNMARYDGIRYSQINHESEPSNLLELYTKTRSRGLGAEVKRRILLGTFVLSSGYYDAYYAKAQKVRALVKSDFTEAFKDVDVILTPVSPTRAFKIGERANDPLAMYLADIFTIPVNLAGLPGISIPVRQVKSEKENVSQSISHVANKHVTDLPIGFQLIGKPFREADILGLGQLYEKI